MAIALETSDQGTWSSNKMSPHLRKSDGDKIEKSDHNGVGRCVCVWGYFPLGGCVGVWVGTTHWVGVCVGEPLLILGGLKCLTAVTRFQLRILRICLLKISLGKVASALFTFTFT